MTLPAPDYHHHDAQLARLLATASELHNGLSNHGPMVIETLAALGRGDAAAHWLDHYLGYTLRRPPDAAPLPSEVWHEALGDPAREAQWRARFASELEAEPWRAVMAHWTPRLTGGFAGAAAHGVIRVAHATRALTELDTDSRRSELAGALGYWAASYMELPGDPTHEHGERTARAALATVPRVPLAERPRQGSISDGLGALRTLDGFGDAVARLDADRPNAVVGLDLAAAFAAMFLGQTRGPLEAIVHTHALTGVAAAMRLAPLVNARAARRLLAHAWQNGCGLLAAYGTEPLEIPPLDDGSGPDDLAAAAVHHGDEHVIKLTEACLEFHDLTGAGRFLRVPQRAMSVLTPTGRPG